MVLGYFHNLTIYIEKIYFQLGKEFFVHDMCPRIVLRSTLN
jgi:hypothetical protein